VAGTGLTFNDEIHVELRAEMEADGFPGPEMVTCVDG